MSLDSEDEVKKALGIESWRNLSKDKIVKFAAMMPDMGKEVSMKLIEQLPKFADFAIDTLKVFEREHKSTLESSAESEAQLQHIQLETLEILRGELDKDLPAEERARVTDYVKGIADKAFEKNSEKMRFLDGLLDKSLILKGVCIAAVLVLVGGKVMIENGGSGNRIA